MAIVLTTPAGADHHLLKRMLQEAKCLPAAVREISTSDRTTIYEVACRSGEGRTLTAICTPVRCLTDPHDEHASEDEP